MDWHWITKEVTVVDKGRPVTKDVRTARQVDSVGNVFQLHGGVEPKACQQCKKKFVYAVEVKPIEQSVGFYKCEDCDFKNASGDSALDHKIITDHKIKKTTEDRFVTTKKIIIGNKANIKNTKNDIIILCDSCLDNDD